MFENLTARLTRVFDGLRGRGRLTDDDVREALREVRMALLEADVVVRQAATAAQAVEHPGQSA